MAHPSIKTMEMTRRIREKNYQRLLGLSRAERLVFYREQALLMNAKAVTFAKAKIGKLVHA